MPKTYTKEQKEKAVELAIELGNVAEAARRSNASANSVRDWLRAKTQFGDVEAPMKRSHKKTQDVEAEKTARRSLLYDQDNMIKKLSFEVETLERENRRLRDVVNFLLKRP